VFRRSKHVALTNILLFYTNEVLCYRLTCCIYTCQLAEHFCSLATGERRIFAVSAIQDYSVERISILGGGSVGHGGKEFHMNMNLILKGPQDRNV